MNYCSQLGFFAIKALLVVCLIGSCVVLAAGVGTRAVAQTPTNKKVIIKKPVKTNIVAKPFSFAAIGDMPYETASPPVKFDRLIKAINEAQPAFTIHIGDIISGRTKCSEANYAIAKSRFNQFSSALIYTPGDNEWTDCHRIFGGQYNALNRLDIIRRMFFSNPARSLGQRPLTLQSQARLMRAFRGYPENRMFEKSGVLFATVHVVGSKNNFRLSSPEAVAEYRARDRANLAWILLAFNQAIKKAAPAIVFAWHANVHATPRFNRSAPYSPAFVKTINAIEAGAKRYGKPVLIISGDFHVFDVAPFLNVSRQPVPNVTRLQVFGDGQVHGTLVRVNPAGPNVFSIAPLLVTANRN